MLVHDPVCCQRQSHEWSTGSCCWPWCRELLHSCRITNNVSVDMNSPGPNLSVLERGPSYRGPAPLPHTSCRAKSPKAAISTRTIAVSWNFMQQLCLSLFSIILNMSENNRFIATC